GGWLRSLSRPAKVTGGLLFCAFLILAFQLRQRDLEFLVEPDFDISLIEAWRAFLVTANPRHLPGIVPDVYMDGQFIVYGLADAGLRWLAAQNHLVRAYFSNEVSFALGAAILVNIVAYAGACTVFFAAVCRLTNRVLLAAPLAVGFFLAPEMLA